MESRELIEECVQERAAHGTRDEVDTTCSFARAERLLGREYHGRFLIELLQNAADAWREADSGGATDVRVVIESDPLALTVANRGAPFSARTVLRSLGQIGKSTKRSGEAIGHKGIGFKSVLEVSRCPELYSSLADPDSGVAVRFDPDTALARIRSASEQWDAWLAEDEEYVEEPLLAVPVLRYPTWVDSKPAIVDELVDAGYTTVIRLPFDAEAFDRDDWISTVTDALDDVSDQILLLLGCFDRVVIDNHLAGTTDVIEVKSGPAIPAGEAARRSVHVTRGGALSSRWWLYRQHHKDDDGLASEIAVGIRVDDASNPSPVHAVTGEPSVELAAPFHLFFPTRIGSGLPFLLHGYFEVDAARTGFYQGSVVGNDAILNRLANLAANAVADVVESELVDPVGLVNLVALAPEPEDPQARRFRKRVLSHLDDKPWIPVEGASRPARLSELLPARGHVCRQVVATFSPGYVERSTGRLIPDRNLSDVAFNFLLTRLPDHEETVWKAFDALLRPGADSPWELGTENEKFEQLLQLAHELAQLDRGQWSTLVQSLAGDTDSRFVPVMRSTGDVELVGVPRYSPGTADNTGVTVMARLSDAAREPLEPPASLRVRFVADGLLSEEDMEVARQFGVRPFTVDSVLDRLGVLRRDSAVVSDLPRADLDQLVSFLWRLLSSERRSDYGTAIGRHKAVEFDPSHWYWLEPDRGRHEGSGRDRQRRLGDLANVPLPTRSGVRRPAGQLAFGEDWADWVEENLSGPDQERRIAALRRLEHLAPDADTLLAPPDAILPLLASPARDLVTATRASGEESAPRDDIALERWAFLLRLGVWEVPPVEGHERRTPARGGGWPWPDTRHALIEGEEEPWNFQPWKWGGHHHKNLTVTEDFRLRWPLVHDDEETRALMAEAIMDGADLYSSLATASALCPRCDSGSSRHTVQYDTDAHERRASTLALQLRRTAWINTTLGGQVNHPARPDEAWWHPRPPTGPALHTSPLQHLRLVRLGEVPSSMRELCGIAGLDDASPVRLHRLLDELRCKLESGGVDVTASTSRQAFITLHRQIYEVLARNREDQETTPPPEVLCQLGAELRYVPNESCRHDNGRHTAFQRQFAGQVPFIILQKDKGNVADFLDVPTFEVTIARKDSSPGEDVTAELQAEFTQRIPELLAVMVHHGAGGATLEPTGDEFHERSRRLQSLRVRRVPDLVLNVQVEGFPSLNTELGAGSVDDTYLDTSQPGAPVLYHDLAGPGWAARLQARLPLHLATLVNAPVYTDVFARLLSADAADREDLLRGWGIGPDDVTSLRALVGAVTDVDRAQRRRWFAALTASAPTPITLELGAIPDEPDELVQLLTRAGFEWENAAVLTRAGAWPENREVGTAQSVLPVLEGAGVDLRVLSGNLVRLGEAPLNIRVAASRFRAWKAAHGSRLAAVLVLSGKVDAETAKEIVARQQAPTECLFALDPQPEELMAPFVALLADAGVTTSAAALSKSPIATLAALAGVGATELDESAAALYDAEAGANRLRTLATSWRTCLIELALVARVAGGTRATIRALADELEVQLPHTATPSGLATHVHKALLGTTELATEFSALLRDELPGTVATAETANRLATGAGLNVQALAGIRRALRTPVDARVATHRARAASLKDANVRPTVPPRLVAVVKSSDEEISAREQSSPGDQTRKIAASKVDPTTDRRKKQLGDDAESWALIAVAEDFLAMDQTARTAAVNQTLDFLDRFEGTPVDAMRRHGAAAKEPDLDPEDLIDQLHGLLHASRHSDNFGFDLLGWRTEEGAAGRPIALEVKSSVDGGFFLSSSEWRRAEELQATATSPASYAVLIVRRTKGSDVPAGMDLLEDPYQLAAEGLLNLDTDTYRVTYDVATPLE